MAEQFLNKLTKLEEKIDGLGETLKRMVTILSEVTEIKSEIRLTKEEILDTIKSTMATTPSIEPQENITELVSKEFSKIQEMMSGIQERMDAKPQESLGTNLQEFIDSRLHQFQEEVRALILNVPAPTPTAPIAAEPTPPQDAAPSIPSAPISVTKSMEIAEHLQSILSFLKMGCKAGDVLDAITDAKDNIMKIVESDPITVKIDKWAGDIGKTPRRNELQARDILKIKKELRKEIDKYSPA